MTGAMIDYSEEHRLNPDNVAWVPGYRFCVKQASKKSRGSWRMATRQYYVMFKIDAAGNLVWRGGVKATEHTMERVRQLYAEGLKQCGENPTITSASTATPSERTRKPRAGSATTAGAGSTRRRRNARCATSR